jgi:predicted adenylyl cyclase CyaB
MRARIGRRTLLRRDDFGAICYVPHRDDFFAVDKPVLESLLKLVGWTEVSPQWEATYISLARLGICETDPPTEEIAYTLPSFVGNFQEIPSIREPLVVNCFSTAYCPLKCQYCHADDLMVQFRAAERNDGPDLDNVVATASSFPAMVAVITGGDPLTRPIRAERLIRKLARQKAVVLDTSGFGDLDALLPTLKEFDVHVRVSWDSIGPENDQVRPVHPDFRAAGSSSGEQAERTIQRCLKEGLSVTVQTVISRFNEHRDPLDQMRVRLAAIGVKHWVLHIAVEGGLARKIEQTARSKGGRAKGIVPHSPKLHESLIAIVEANEQAEQRLDIRITETNSTPNSVLLIDSKGDLYTEGFAHNGKVLLFEARTAKPDQVRAKWAHIDKFGHATRYLNWNKWLHRGKSLERLCYRVPIPPPELESEPRVIETEAKFQISEPAALLRKLEAVGYIEQWHRFQRDEYYDVKDRTLGELDYVIRLRVEDGTVMWAFKGPRFRTDTLEYSRLEFELPVPEDEARRELDRRGLSITWVFEKRRTEFKRDLTGVGVFLDEVPELGFFLDIEGPLAEVRAAADELRESLGPQQTQNYMELFVAHKSALGISREQVEGAYFS